VQLTETLPHLIAGLNATSVALLISALLAIRRGRRDRHRDLMIGNLAVSFLFVVAYLTQIALVGHKRFPGDDWVRTLFLAILTSHTLLAISLLPLVARTLYLAARRRFAEHRRIARVTYPIWLYVSLTGVVVYWMINHLRSPA
jgi:putative membrane protein